MTRRVHQFLPTLSTGDATASHALQIRRALDDEGIEGALYVEHDRSDRPGTLARPYVAHAADAAPGDVLLYHLAVGSVVADYVRDRPEPLLVDFHNLTPPRFFAAWPPGPGEPDMTWAVEWGLRQRDELAASTVWATTVSRFNQVELAAAGYGRTSVVPILLDTATFDHGDGDGVSVGHGDGPLWLFVGRIAPNKAQHDLLLALAAARRTGSPDARLALVGGVSSSAYRAALGELVEALDLEGAVTFTGPVTDAELGAWYRAADVFVCLSDHEGFCVPVVEAMYHELPVIAFAAGAVPETVGGGALVLGAKEPVRVATAIERIVGDEAVRSGLIAAGRDRLDDFALARTRRQLLDALLPVLDELDA
ncbi:MAG: glycosyltransferase family 4 protein [Actinomycetota bacterium]